MGWSYLRESLLSKRSQHGWPGSNPVQKGHKPWPSVHVDLVNFRPIQDRIRIGVGDSECLFGGDFGQVRRAGGWGAPILIPTNRARRFLAGSMPPKR